jgi:ABC-type cobalamin transport system ATPase subunit
MNKLLIQSAVGLAAFAGIAGTVFSTASASAAAKPHTVTAVNGVAASVKVPTKAPAGVSTVTAQDDEPTGNLDSQTGKVIFDLLHNLSRAEHTTVIVVTHDLGIARQADKVFQLQDGKLHQGKQHRER